MTYSEPTAQYPTALVTSADLLKPEYDATTDTLLQDITSGSPAAGAKLYVNDKTNFSTNGGVVLIESSSERIGYTGTGTDGTGDYLTVDERAYPGGSAASAASSGDTVSDIISAEHMKRVHVELIAVQTYLGTSGDSAPSANTVLYGDGAGTSTWSGNPTLTGITLGNTGLHLEDTNASHDLIIAPGSDLTADRTLTLTTGDADRTLTLSGNLTVESASLVNQDLTSDASPTFAGATLTALLTTQAGIDIQEESSDLANPSAGDRRIFARDSGGLVTLDSDGNRHEVEFAGGRVLDVEIEPKPSFWQYQDAGTDETHGALRFEAGDNTLSTGTKAITFAQAFTELLDVFLISKTGANAMYPSGLGTSGFTANGSGSDNFAWLAIGVD